jgi:hypothetical protein
VKGERPLGKKEEKSKLAGKSGGGKKIKRAVTLVMV